MLPPELMAIITPSLKVGATVGKTTNFFLCVTVIMNQGLIFTRNFGTVYWSSCGNHPLCSPCYVLSCDGRADVHPEFQLLW